MSHHRTDLPLKALPQAVHRRLRVVEGGCFHIADCTLPNARPELGIALAHLIAHIRWEPKLCLFSISFISVLAVSLGLPLHDLEI